MAITAADVSPISRMWQCVRAFGRSDARHAVNQPMTPQDATFITAGPNVSEKTGVHLTDQAVCEAVGRSGMAQRTCLCAFVLDSIAG